jgi:hypothetical protein
MRESICWCTQTVDTLGLLAEKKLTPRKTLQNCLYELRMAYVDHHARRRRRPNNPAKR